MNGKKVYDQVDIHSQEKKWIFSKIGINYNKLIFSEPIEPIVAAVHPGWKNLNRETNDPLDDITEDITRKKLKKLKKQQNKINKANNSTPQTPQETKNT